MDTTLLNAGRTTHLKIVAVSLLCAIVVVLVGINARTTDTGVNVVVKAGEPAQHAGQESSTVR
jgi:hypothetical protein